MRNETHVLVCPNNNEHTIGFTKVDDTTTKVHSANKFTKTNAKVMPRTTAMAYYRQLVKAGWVPVVKA